MKKAFELLLQQSLPSTVLKLLGTATKLLLILMIVATVLTVYGIETRITMLSSFGDMTVATVLTVYGIETQFETANVSSFTFELQQSLPSTVLKHSFNRHKFVIIRPLSCNSPYRLRY